MTIFREIIEGGLQQAVFCHDAESGLRAVIAIHNTSAGPALGGCRFMPYADEDEAIRDAMRLARGMTYKNAAYKLPYGGGKAVIWQEPEQPLPDQSGRIAMFQALGRHIESLGGRYITGVDLGTSILDMDAIRTQTEYVTDISGSIMAEDDFTAEMTAYGVYRGMQSSVKQHLGLPSLYDLQILVQGLGKVGMRLCRYLYEDGARLLVSDVRGTAAMQAVRKFGAKKIKPEDVYGTKCDLFAPCAMGSILNDKTIPRLRCSIVAGAANNQLLMARHADLLASRNILYVPDYILNAGGIIITAGELQGQSRQQLVQSVERVAETTLQVLEDAEEMGITPAAAADALAEGFLQQL